jgi:hypothetical protein
MALRDLIERLTGPRVDTPQPVRGASQGQPSAQARAAQARNEALHRLQMGLVGLVAMVVVIGVAGMLGGQADSAQQAAVPDAAPTTEPSTPITQRDPLADAGVVPDIPVDPEAVLAEPEIEAELDPDLELDPELSDTPDLGDDDVAVPDTLPTDPEIDNTLF